MTPGRIETRNVRVVSRRTRPLGARYPLRIGTASQNGSHQDPGYGIAAGRELEPGWATGVHTLGITDPLSGREPRSAPAGTRHPLRISPLPPNHYDAARAAHRPHGRSRKNA